MRINFDTSRLKQQVEDQPLIALGVVAALLSGAAKMMNANANRKNSNSWARETKRREKKDKQ